jgi:hypothetical protein
MADTLCRRTAASEATALPSQLALDPAEVAEEPKLLLKLHSLSSSWTRPDLTRHFSSALGQILVKHWAKKRTTQDKPGVWNDAEQANAIAAGSGISGYQLYH